MTTGHRCAVHGCGEFATGNPTPFTLETDRLNLLPPHLDLDAVAYLCPTHHRISDSLGILRAYRNETQ